jgi:hypothetical protein
MRGAEDLAEAKMRILESERALSRLDAGSTLNPDQEILRDRFTRQLREGLEDYFSILSGDQRKAGAKDI